MNVQGKVWGETQPLFNKNNVETHLIQVKKGGFCSKHKHSHKYNQFIVIKGKLKVSIWKDYKNTFGHSEILEDISIIQSGQSCIVSPGDYHRFEALEDTQALEIYWVNLKEEDITRVDCGGIRNVHQATANVCDSKSTERKETCVSEQFRRHVASREFPLSRVSDRCPDSLDLNYSRSSLAYNLRVLPEEL